MKPLKKVIVVVPIYNENKRAINTINNILKVFKGDIVVINDGSTDETEHLLLKHYLSNKRVTIKSYIENKGKGAALRIGVQLAWKKEGDAVIFIDADGQHNPKYIKKFIEKLDSNMIVFGYRLLSKNMPLLRRLGNIFAVYLIRVLFNIRKKDLLSGYLGFRKEVYEQIKWKSNRYGIETEMATKIGKNKLEFCEFRIETIYIDKYKGVTLIDAIKVLTQIPHWYFLK